MILSRFFDKSNIVILLHPPLSYKACGTDSFLKNVQQLFNSIVMIDAKSKSLKFLNVIINGAKLENWARNVLKTDFEGVNPMYCMVYCTPAVYPWF